MFYTERPKGARRATGAEGNPLTLARKANPLAEKILYWLSLRESMAKHGKGRRKMGRYLKGNVEDQVSLSTLGAGAVVLGIFDETVNERTRVSSLDGIWTLSEHTAGEGPLVFGVAHSDYSSAEVLEWIDNTGSWNEGDLVNQEVAKRKIRQIGVFDGLTTEETMNEGKPIKTKLNWILLQGQTLDMWVFNRNAAALTTGSLVNINGHCNLWPQ